MFPDVPGYQVEEEIPEWLLTPYCGGHHQAVIVGENATCVLESDVYETLKAEATAINQFVP